MARKPRDLFNKKNVKEVNEELGFLEDQLLSIADRLSTTIKGAIDDIKDEAKGVNEILGNQVNKSIKDLAKGLNQTLKNTMKLNQGLLKTSDIENQIFDRLMQQESAKRNLETLEQKGIISKEAYKKALVEIKDAEDAHNALLEYQLSLAEKIQKRMGLTGKIIEGISKIPILGEFIDAKEATKEMQKAAAQGASQFGVMAVGLKEVGKSIIKNLTDPLVIITGMIRGIRAIVGLMTQMSKEALQTGQSFLNFAGKSKQVTDNLREAAKSNFFMNMEEATAHMVNINNLTGTSIQLNQSQLDTMQQLTNTLGLSGEQASKLFKLSVVTGTSFETTFSTIKATVDELNRNEKQALSLNDVLDKLSNMSAQTKANLGNNPKALAEAAFQASKLGLELSDIQAAAESTLDFENSIEAEMKAELFLGKNLNLERLRSLTLQGKTGEVAKEMGKIIKDNIDATEGNVFAQQALADSLGISRERMFEINEEMKFQDKMAKQGLEGVKSQAEFDKAVLRVQREELKLTGKKLSLEEAAQRVAQEDIDALNKQVKGAQTFNRIIEQAKEAFLAAFADSDAIKNFQEAMNKFIEGGGMENAVKLISKVGGIIGDIVSFAVKNPKTFFGGLTVALIALKRIPQLVVMVGAGKLVSKLTSKMSGIFTKGFSSLKTGLLGKKVGGQFIKGGGRAAAGARSGGLLKGVGGAFKMVGKGLGNVFGKMKSFGGGIMSKLGKGGLKGLGKSLIKKIPGIGLLAGVGFGISRALKGDFAGAAMELGSGLASTVPGVGTALSAGIDGALLARDMSGSASMPGSEAADFISRPGQPIQKFRADDVVIGGTNLGGSGGSGNNEIASLLGELLSAVKEGGDVFLDGNKVGKALVLATSKMS
jgi:hypothetical protein